MDECWSVALRDSLVLSGVLLDVLLAVSPSAVGKLEIMVNLSDLSVKQLRKSLRKSFKYAQIFRRLRRA